MPAEFCKETSKFAAVLIAVEFVWNQITRMTRGVIDLITDHTHVRFNPLVLMYDFLGSFEL